MKRKEVKQVPPIPVEWLEKQGLKHILAKDRVFTSENMAFLYTLISDWKKENEGRDGDGC